MIMDSLSWAGHWHNFMMQTWRTMARVQVTCSKARTTVIYGEKVCYTTRRGDKGFLGAMRTTARRQK